MGTAIAPSFQDSAVFLMLKEIKGSSGEPHSIREFLRLTTTVQHLKATLRTLSLGTFAWRAGVSTPFQASLCSTGLNSTIHFLHTEGFFYSLSEKL